MIYLLIFLLFLIIIDFIKNNKICSPGILCNLTFFICLSLYSFYLSNLQQVLSNRTLLTLFIFLIAYNIPVFLSYYARPIVVHKSQINYVLTKKRQNIICLCAIAFLIIEIIYSGGIPLIWKLTGSDKTYFDFGIPSFNGVFYGVVILMGAYSLFKKGPYKFIYIGIALLIISRQIIISIAIEGVIFKLLTLKNKPKHLGLLLIAGIVVIILGFSVMGNFRTGEQDFLDVAKFKPEYDWIPVSFKWIYSYLCFSFSNFNNLVSMTDGAVNFGSSVFNDLLPTILANKLGIAENFKANYLVSPNFTVSTFLPSLYLDFGLPGIFLFCLTIGIIIQRVYYRTKNYKNDVNCLAYAILGHNVLLMFFNNMFFYLPVLVQFFFLFVFFKKQTQTEANVYEDNIRNEYYRLKKQSSFGFKLIEKYKALPHTLKASIWFVVALLFQKGINIISTPIFTRLMTKPEYATYSLFNTWYNIFLIICTFNLFGGIFNTIIHTHKDSKNEITSSTMGFQLLMTLIAFCGFLVFHFLGGTLQGLDFTLSILIFVQIAVNISTSLWLARGKYEYKYRACATVIIIQSAALTALSILLVYFLQDKVMARVVANIVVLGVVSVALFIIILKNSRKIFNLKNYKYLLILGAPLVVHYLAQDIMSQSDQLIIDAYFGGEKVAVYSLAHSLSWIFTILTTAINTTYVPWVYKKLDVKNCKSIRKISLLIISLICCITLLVSLMAPELILLFGGKDYAEGAVLVPILIGNVILIAGYDLFSNLEFYYSKTLVASVITLVCAGVNIALNFAIIPAYGNVAACVSTLISYCLMMFLHFIAMKYYEKKNGLNGMYNSKLIWIISLAFISLNISTIFIQDFIIVRYLILSTILVGGVVIMYLYSDKIKTLIKPENKKDIK